MAGDAELARGWQALGMSDWGEAREAFQAAIDREETPEALEGLGVATGWLGDARTSVAVRERAYLGYRRRGDDEAAARARLELAGCLLAAGAPEPAVVQARAARAALAGLGAAQELRRAERLLARVPAPRSSTGLALTDREVEVVRLVARGRTNEEIAAELVLSVRTVERHLSNLYVKVGASGRTARAVATAYARTHGLA